VLDLLDEAAEVVDRWEALYFDVASRPPPRGPRVALEQAGQAQVESAEAPYVG
jgi:hypothetical protein